MFRDDSPLISIIVPVYNASMFLNKCLKSITKQTYENLDIILVNDGSTDKSRDICEKWKNDSRISVYHKKNEGVSSARNYGLDKVKGEYVCFVDADDWLPLNGVELLVNNAITRSSDFVFGCATGIGTISKKYYGKNSGMTILTSDVENLIQYASILKTELSPWAKLFKAELIKDNNIVFPVGVAYGEDSIFVLRYLKNCYVVSSIPDTVYFYSQLNKNRACGKYYPNINMWLSEVVKCYSEIYRKKTMEAINNIEQTAMIQFKACCEHYLDKIDTSQKNVLILKFQETIEIFRPIMFSLLEADLEIEEYKLEEKQYGCLDFIKSRDGEGLFNQYSKYYEKKAVSTVNRLFRNMIVDIKQIIVYMIRG